MTDRRTRIRIGFQFWNPAIVRGILRSSRDVASCLLGFQFPTPAIQEETSIPHTDPCDRAGIEQSIGQAESIDIEFA
jgi:hypothetical protein